MNTNSLLQEYYKALQEALQQIFKALTSVRKDTLTRLVLGGVIGGTATEIAQAVGMDYETVLKNLDKIANINLIKIVKEIVKDHPVQLRRHTQPQRIRKSTTSIKKRNTSLLLQRTQKIRTSNTTPNNSNKRPIHKRNLHYNNNTIQRPIHKRNLHYNNNTIQRPIHKRNLHYNNNTIHTTKSCRNTQGEKAEYKTKIQLYLETLPTILNKYNITTISFDSWYVNSKTLTLSGNSRQTHVLSRVADTCQLPSSPKGNT
ncbi:putative transposase [Sulfurisphaera tokodaii str. 7]|uniref:Transposase n=2 Tax=Sulfurisphaera tokodaii TaxID=111955 RepID=Q974D6_SULTO|nr:putative transposase [Sulfurisphaera tokodaii str. 7]